MPVDHYENFPVGSWLLPARLRAPIEAVYAFARGADDLADEGAATDAERLAALDGYLRRLDAIERGDVPPEGAWPRIAATIHAHALPVPLLRDLVDAFQQDVRRKRYDTYAEIRDYARRSANPVGRLVLHLFEEVGYAPRGTYSREASDAICSALQFANFWQDIAVDWAKGRVYLPREDLERFRVTEAQIAAGRADAAWAALLRFECDRTRALLHAGAPLGNALPGRLGLEIRATVAGGARILDRIDAVSGDVFRNRPVLGPLDWMRVLTRAVLKRP